MNKLPKQYHSDWRMMASLANNTARGKRPSSNINWSSKAKDYQKKLDKLLDKINDKRVAAGKKPINFQQQIQKAQAKLSKALGMKTSKEEKKVTKTEKKSTRYTASYNSSPVQQKSAGKKSGWADIDWGDDEKEEGLEDEAGRDPADGLDAYEIDENDVNLNSGASIFEQISLRYKRSYNKVLD
jgi:hypothetical protein